ncbi:hypothetical protein [Bdellovibrio sp. HCB337]|uniref:hypothetical protein n=1 Tax=Bdellovibrio sp. HCB337 TaxID=3394358 RepID=UPI0039A40AFE
MNKLFYFLSLTLISSWALALGGGGSAGGNGNSISRAELLKLNRFYMIEMPAVKFQDRQVGVQNVCLEGPSVKTIDPILFEEYDTDRHDNKVNVRKEMRTLIRPMEQETVDCSEYRDGWCVSYKKSIEKVGTKFNVDVYEVPRGDNSFGKLRYKVNYQLPSCSQL